MKVAILGAGAIAYGNAALLCRDGHDVTLWSPSGKRTTTLAGGASLAASGAIVGSFAGAAETPRTGRSRFSASSAIGRLRKN